MPNVSGSINVYRPRTLVGNWSEDRFGAELLARVAAPAVPHAQPTTEAGDAFRQPPAHPPLQSPAARLLECRLAAVGMPAHLLLAHGADAVAAAGRGDWARRLQGQPEAPPPPPPPPPTTAASDCGLATGHGRSSAFARQFGRSVLTG